MATATSPTTPGGSTKPRSAVYTGGCHCGRIEFTVKLSPPVEEGPVTSCECSICHLNGYMMVYPLESNITWIRGKDEMTQYTFGPARIAHTFCNVCGTSIGGKSNDPNFFQNNRALNVSGTLLRRFGVAALPVRFVMAKTLTRYRYRCELFARLTLRNSR